MASDQGNLDEPFELSIDLDRTSSTPLYTQIAEPLEHLISTGTLLPGRLIEDEISMACRLSVSRPTARRALQELVSRGLVTRRRGVGTRVTPKHVRRPLALTSLNDDLTKAGFTPRTEVLRYEVLLADEDDAAKLGCTVDEEIVRVTRRRWIDNKPLAIMTNLLPARYAPSFTDLAHQGLYSCIRERGIELLSATQSVGARNASEVEAELLHIGTGSSLLTMERTAYDGAGAAVEYGLHYYDAQRYSFKFTLSSE